MNRIVFFAATVIMCLSTAMAKAQDDKKEKVPVYNYVLDDPMDAFGRQPLPETVISPLIFPEFYSYKPMTNKDTLFKYECYDARNALVNVDTLRDFDAVRFISLFKSYADPTQKYTDATGKEQPLPVQKIIYRYDKAGTDKWLSVNYANNEYINLKEFKKDIVKTDTAEIRDPSTGVTRNVVHRYYRIKKK